MNQPEEVKEFDSFESDATAGAPEKARGSGLAWLALVIALAAVAGSAYLWWHDLQLGSERSGQSDRLAALQAAQSETQAVLAALASRVSDAERTDSSQELAALRQSMNALERTLSGLEGDLSDAQSGQQAAAAALFELEQSFAAVEATVAAVAARGDTPAQRLDMYEVESLLRSASERLQLFAEVDAADEALALADARLAAMADPVYLSVRQRIARARQTLAELELPDPVLVEGRIAALQGGVVRLPFPGEIVAEEAPDDSPPEGLWARFKAALSGLVTVRRKAPTDDALMTIGDKDYLRQGLWLQLETARLAVMRQDDTAYQAALKRANDTLGRYFDSAAPRVRTATDELQALSGIRLTPVMPDISAPWRQLRRLRESAPVAEPAQDDPVTAEPASIQAEPVTEETPAEESGG